MKEQTRKTIKYINFMHTCFAPQQLSEWVSGCRAEELVQRLLVAYDSPTGIPYNSIALDTLEVGPPKTCNRKPHSSMSLDLCSCAALHP